LINKLELKSSNLSTKLELETTIKLCHSYLPVFCRFTSIKRKEEYFETISAAEAQVMYLRGGHVLLIKEVVQDVYLKAGCRQK
jgi:hypothetical protein